MKCLKYTSILFVAKLSFNSTSTSDNTATQPHTNPTRKVVKWNKTSNTSIEDFIYFNWRVQILGKLSLNSNSTPAQPQLNSILTQLNLNSNYWAWHYSAQACIKHFLVVSDEQHGDSGAKSS